MARIHVGKNGSAAQVALDSKQEEIGPLVGIEILERGSSSVRWLLEIDAQTAEGRFRVGRVLTLSPVGTGGIGGLGAVPGGNASSRLVAVALCPGARGWMITATAFEADGLTRAAADAELFVSRAKEQQAAIGPGVTAVNPQGAGRQVARVLTAQFFAGPVIQVYAPEQPFRIRATIVNADVPGGATIFVGDATGPTAVTAANGFPLLPGDRFVTEGNRAMAVITAGGAVPAATLLEEG
jgi:hypothetical protein